MRGTEAGLVVVPLEERFGDGQVDVVSYKVGEFQRTHAEPGPSYSRVHRRGLSAGLDDPQRLQVERPCDAVHDKARRVGDANRRLAEALGGLLRPAHDLGVGGRSGHYLDELHRGHRVEEVHAHDALRALRGRGDPGDGEGGGVGGEHRIFVHHALEVGEDLSFDVHALDHGLHDQRGFGAVLDGRRRRDPFEDLAALILGDTALLHAAVQVSLDRLPTSIQGVLAHIEHHRRHAGEGRALRDPRPHRARPHDNYIRHPSLLLAYPSTELIVRAVKITDNAAAVVHAEPERSRRRE